MDEKILEIAETQVENEKQAVIDRIRAKIPTLPKNYDGACTECGEPVAEGRQKLGYSVCIDCQESRERQDKHFRGDHQEIPYDLLSPLIK